LRERWACLNRSCGMGCGSLRRWAGPI